MFILRHGSLFLLAYLLIGIGLLIAIATPFNEAFVKSLMWTSPPILLLSLAFTRHFMRIIRSMSLRSVRSIWFHTYLTAGVLSFVSWPYALLMNATVGEGTPVEIGGRVQEKFESGSKSTSFVLVTWSDRLNQEVKLTVPQALFKSIEIGSSYTECFYVGPLGFYYRWRYAESRPVCLGRSSAPESLGQDELLRQDVSYSKP
jgi:hypothetical protein